MGVVAVPRREVWTRQPPRNVGANRDLDWDFLWSASAAEVNQALGGLSAPVTPRVPGHAGVYADFQATSAAQTWAIPAASTYTLFVVLCQPLASTGSGGRILSNGSAGVRLEAFTTGGGQYLNTTHTGVAAGVSWVTAVGGFDTRPWTYVLTYDGTTQRGWLRDSVGVVTEASPATIGISTPSQVDIGYIGGASCGIYAAGWRRGAVGAANAKQILANPWAQFRKRPARIFLPAAGGSYTLTAAAGSYALTGQPVALLVSRSIAAAQGSYTLTGQDVALRRLYALTAAQGSYSLSGQAVGLLLGRTLAAGQGAYTLTGQAVGLLAQRVLSAGQGSYALTGQATGLVYTPAGSYSLLASAGAYTLTGQAVGLLLQRSLAAAQGAYALTGQAVALLAGRSLTAGQGSYAITGQPVGLTYTPAGATYTLAAGQGAYTLTGQAINFGRTYALAAGAGSYTLTGQAVALSYSGAPPTEVYAAITAYRRAHLGAGSATRPAQRSTARRPPQ